MMNTIREAINAGARDITLRNGTIIRLYDKFSDSSESFGTIKVINGNPVFRWVFFSVNKNKRTNLSAITHRCQFVPEWDFCYFRENDYIAKEREVNEFISDNGGIDEYRTMYWVNQYDY